MGLAASQGRLLMLTARNHDLVYEGQQISQARIALLEAQSEAARKYNEAMNNTIMQASYNGKTELLTYDNLTSQDPFSGLCMRLIDKDGNVVIPGESIEVTSKETAESEGKDAASETVSKTSIYSSSAEFIKACMPDLSKERQTELSSYSLADITKYFNETYNQNENITAVHKNKNNNSLVKEGEKVLIDTNLNDPAYIQMMLLSGDFLIQQAQPDGSFQDIVWQGSNSISEVLDTSDDAAAEAEYEAAMIELQKKDKIYELRLEQVETEQKAVNTEIDTAKNIIKENVEQSFKTFTA